MLSSSLPALVNCFLLSTAFLEMFSPSSSGLKFWLSSNMSPSSQNYSTMSGVMTLEVFSLTPPIDY